MCLLTPCAQGDAANEQASTPERRLAQAARVASYQAEVEAAERNVRATREAADDSVWL